MGKEGRLEWAEGHHLHDHCRLHVALEAVTCKVGVQSHVAGEIAHATAAAAAAALVRVGVAEAGKEGRGRAIEPEDGRPRDACAHVLQPDRVPYGGLVRASEGMERAVLLQVVSPCVVRWLGVGAEVGVARALA